MKQKANDFYDEIKQLGVEKYREVHPDFPSPTCENGICINLKDYLYALVDYYDKHIEYRKDNY